MRTDTATENTTTISPELTITTMGGYHNWWPTTKADGALHGVDEATAAALEAVARRSYSADQARKNRRR